MVTVQKTASNTEDGVIMSDGLGTGPMSQGQVAAEPG